MIDKSKRRTLKTIVVASGTIAIGGVSATVSLGSASQQPGQRLRGDSPSFQELGQIEITTRLSALKNDLEVVITNTGSEAVTITQMTPGVARVARGEFNFSAVLADGPLHLSSGASVIVPMQQKPVNVAATLPPLSEVLKNTVSVITDADSFASITIVEGAAVAA